MKTKISSLVLISLCLTALTATQLACGSIAREDPRFTLSGSEQRLELTGKVVSIDKPNQTITVAHAEIKDYMPAMTMPFMLKDEWAFDKMKPGDQIAAALIVDGPRAWLQEIVITSGDPVTGATGAPVKAQAGDEVPNFKFINQDGKQISIHGYRGKALLLTFIYTRCPVPDYCTLMSNNFAQIEAQLQKEVELKAKTHLLSVSIDPAYDTPAVLRSYGAAHTGKYSDEKFKDWEFASGSKDETKAIAEHFGLQYFPQDDQILHGLRTVIIQPDGKVLKVYEGNDWKPDEVLGELKKLFAV